MAFNIKRACDFIFRCFASSDGDDDDTEQIVDYSVPPPVDGSAMPNTGGDNNNPCRFELDELFQIFNEKLNAVRNELAETHQREIAALRNDYEEHIAILAHAHRRDVDDLNDRLTAVNERCDKLVSRVNTLNEQLRYEEPNFPEYSDNYVREDQEVMPEFSS